MNLRLAIHRLTALALGLTLLVLPACDSLLDIDPKQSIPSEAALQTPENVETALNGAYNAMSSSSLYGGLIMMLPDLHGDADELNFTGTFEEPREIWRKNILVNNFYVQDQWADAYESINIANNVLEALEVFEDESRRDNAAGGAYFIRGALHFELVRLYGRAWNDGDPNTNLGVPVVVTATETINEDIYVPRAPVAKVYEQAIADLKKAKELLPDGNGAYADTYAASAMLARIYLQQERYQDAAQEASRVIESGVFELAPTFAAAFNNAEDIPEYIFATQITPQDGSNSLNRFYASEENNGRGDIDVLPPHFELYEDGDARADFFYTDGSGAVRTTKWQDDEADGANVPVIRLAEMYLIRAEGNLRAGTSTGAAPVDDVNTIRARAGLDALDSVTLDDVLRERKIELSFEGHTLHDAKRLQRSVGQLSWNAPALIYPIPQRELDANENLEQNSGYGA